MAPEERIDALLDALAEASIDFIVIGGLAVGWHGFIRATKDIDVAPVTDRVRVLVRATSSASP